MKTHKSYCLTSVLMVKEGWTVEQVTEWLTQFVINLKDVDDTIYPSHSGDA